MHPLMRRTAASMQFKRPPASKRTQKSTGASETQTYLADVSTGRVGSRPQSECRTACRATGLSPRGQLSQEH